MRGYHAYKDIWTAVVGEELPCQREVSNWVDVFAVAVMRGETVVGHVPKKISSVCSLYLRQDGSIVCRVTGSRRYSEDLAQGGLESVPEEDVGEQTSPATSTAVATAERRRVGSRPHQSDYGSLQRTGYRGRRDRRGRPSCVFARKSS